MEAFKVFAALSLVDLMSNPLSRIRGGMDAVDKSAQSLSARFGNLAMSMAPLALAGGAVLGAFGKCVSTAAGFEDQMAKVGAISRACAEDMQLLEAKARELGASTQFTASEVGQAEQYLAMAGFSAKENIEALPGVLNLAAATATDLGRAADISSDILGAFGMKANEMGRVADVLAKTCSTANTDMEKLGDTMKYVAPVARTAGLAIEDTAAMAGLLGNVGIKGSQAGTSLKAMLNKLAAPAKEGQEALAKLGVTVKDQAGNLRSPIKVLGEMAGKLKAMGTAEQMAAMKAIVGEEAIAGFAELIEQGGIGKIEEYANKLRDAGGTCEKMAKTMNNTLAGDMRGMGSAFESVQITIGKLFIPESFADTNFGLSEYADSTGRKLPAYLLSRDAFSLLVMGFTGKAALLWKLRYIEAFNALEKEALENSSELAWEAGYLQGRQEALGLPVVEAERKKAYLDGMKEGIKIGKREDRLTALQKIHRYLEMGLTCAEIGKILGLTRSAVQCRVSRARKSGFWPQKQGNLLEVA